MPYLFTCPHCQTKTQVEDRFSGQAGQCVSCGGEIQLPEFSGTSHASAPQDGVKSLRWIVASLVAVILLGCFIFAAAKYGGDTMNRFNTNRIKAASKSNLEKIAKALNAYAADFGTYPPPFTRAANGQKLHSWRVLILPYLGEEELYNQFKLDVSWDDPENMSVAYNPPSVFKHPDATAQGMYSETAYFYIVGTGTLFPPKAKPLGPNAVVDDPGQTILVIEGKPLVPSRMWTEPMDLDFAKMVGNVGGTVGVEPGGLIDDGAMMATVDGRGHFLPITTDTQTFRALVTPSGGERLRDDLLD